MRAVAAGAPVDKRTAVRGATGVPGQPPPDPVVRGGVFTETRRAALPCRGPSPASAQRNDPRPRALVVRSLAGDPGSDRLQRGRRDRLGRDARAAAELASPVDRDAAVGVHAPDAPRRAQCVGQRERRAPLRERAADQPRICDQIRSGPLGHWVDDFVDVLMTRGYATGTVRRHVRAAAIFSAWLDQ